MPIYRLCSGVGLFVIAAVTVTSSGCDGARYDGYSLSEIPPHTEGSAEDLMKFLKNSELDVRRPSHDPGDPAEVMVSPEKISFFKDYVQSLGLNPKTGMTDNIDTLNRSGVAKFRLSNDRETQESGRFSWRYYYTVESIIEWLEAIAKKHSPIVTLLRKGPTAQLRHLVGVRIAYKADLPVVFITAGMQGCDWIGTATATWLIYYVLTIRNEIARSYEWHVFPVVNPDGYDYTRWEGVRRWPKNRSQYVNDCRGVDLNRNWPFQWDSGPGYCSLEYGGPQPSSEVETSELIRHMDLLEGRIRVYMNLRDIGQALLYPWSYTKEAPKDRAMFERVAAKVRHEITWKKGSVYTHGTVGNVTMTIDGTAIDYVYNILGVKCSFEYWHRYMRQEETRPADYIIPTAIEALDVLTVILQEGLE